MVGFPLVFAFSEQDMPGIEPGPLMIKKFCVRASVQLVDLETVQITYGILPVSLEDLKKEYTKHKHKPGYPNILFRIIVCPRLFSHLFINRFLPTKLQ